MHAYRELEERVGIITTNRGSKTELIYSAVNRKMASFSVVDIQSDCPGISRDMIRQVLRKMRDEGVIIASSKGRGAMWRKTFN